MMEDDILTERIPIADGPRWGRIDKPGLGVEVDEDKLNVRRRLPQARRLPDLCGQGVAAQRLPRTRRITHAAPMRVEPR